MSRTNATPRPWKQERAYVLDGEGDPIADCLTIGLIRRLSSQKTQADAELIVRAVNAHDDLVTALQHARRVIVVACEANAPNYASDQHVAVLEIDAALSKACGP
jgi:hypothetical protein